MRRRLLDTQRLIAHWKRRREGRPEATIRVEEAKKWAQELIAFRKTDAIATPVRVEFLAGVHNPDDLLLARAYLADFRVVDDGMTTAETWEEAERLASWARGAPRKLGDCLIFAIASILGYEVDSEDSDFVRMRSGPQPQRKRRR